MQTDHHSICNGNQSRAGGWGGAALSPELFEGIKRGTLVAVAALAFGLPVMHLYRAYTAQQSPVSAGEPISSNTGNHTSSGTSAVDITHRQQTQLEKLQQPQQRQQRRYADFYAERASSNARFVANWVTDTNDNRNLSFVIIDKKNAKLFVFSAAGKLLGATPVLLGAARGDDSVVGIGQRPIAQVRPEERTTPAGRFMGEPGLNTSGEDVVWVDYEAAVSMHRVRVVDPKQRRLERLASPTTADNRISYGCVNVPVAFFENVLSPQFKSRYGVVYVLPEVKPMRQVFAAAYAATEKYAGSRTARWNGHAAPRQF